MSYRQRRTPGRGTDGGGPAGSFGAVAAVAMVVGLSLVPAPATAQEWSLEARAGRLDFRLAEDVPAATSVGVGLTRVTTGGWFHLSAGVPLGDEDPLWGALNVGGRLGLVEGRAFTLGVDASGQGYVQRYPRSLDEQDGGLMPGNPFDRVVTDGTTWGRGLAASALPVAALDLGRVAVEARAGVAWYQSALGGNETTRNVPLADMAATVDLAGGVYVGATARRFAAPDGDYSYGGLTARVLRPEVRVWGSVGHWLGESLGVPWSAGAALPLSDRFEVTVEGRQDVVEPLYGSAPRRAWSVGARVGLTDPPEPARPIPAAYQGGQATIAVEASDVDGAPRIAGDFTGWEPRPMTRVADRWQYTAPLEPGVYEYAFVDPDGDWFVPTSVAGRKDDGMGGEVALLVVEGEER